MGRTPNTDARREQIARALITEMAHGGYEGATIAKVAKTAGLLPGLVHYHFETKQEILLAAVALLVRGVEQRFEDERRGEGPRLALEARLEAYLGRGEADLEAVRAWVALGTEALRQPEVGAVYREVLAEQIEAFEDLVRAVLSDEGRERRGSKEIAVGIVAALEGIYRVAAAAPDQLPEGFAARTVRRITEGMIAAQPLREPKGATRKKASRL